MLVFIDESGDCGLKFDKGSSPFFTCTAVVFSGRVAANSCDRGIDELRRRLGYPSTHEFHFSHSSEKVREAFFRAVVHEDFRYGGFVLDKKRLYGTKFTSPKAFYEFAVSLACEQMRMTLEDAKIVIDKNGDRTFKNRLEKTLKLHMTDPDGTCRVRKVTMEASHSNNLVQLADMICGAVGRSFSGRDSSYRGIIKRHEKVVQLWPKWE
jgi:hypothetical protein